MSIRLSAILLIASLATFGCNKPHPPGAGHNSGGPGQPAAGGGDHAHGAGPHGGTIIELGADEYHAELIHDPKSGSTTIHLLDGAAKADVAIEAQEIRVDLTHDGHGEQFTLAASPQEKDPAGKSSRFTSLDKHLSDDLDDKDAVAELVVTISGKQFRGSLKHSHEGEDEHGHDHEHGHEHGEGDKDHDHKDEPAADKPSEEKPAEDASEAPAAEPETK